MSDEKIILDYMNLNQNVKVELAKSFNMNDDILKKLANDEDGKVRYCVAKNENAPSDVLKTLASDNRKDVRKAVARNKNTPSVAFKLLARDDNEDIRSLVAENMNTPVEVLDMLAKDDSEDVRMGVASNSNTSVDMLEALASDDWLVVRIAVAELMDQYLKKGALIGVEGRIQTRSYDDKDGKRVYVTEVIAESVQFLESKNTGTQEYSQDNEQEDSMNEYGSNLGIANKDLPF